MLIILSSILPHAQTRKTSLLNLPAPIASVMLVLYVSDFSSFALAPLSALDVEPEIAYKQRWQCSCVRKS